MQNQALFDLTEIRHIERVVVCRFGANGCEDDAEMQKSIKRINYLLNDCSPKGKIISKDISFKIFQMGEHQIVAQSVAYHIAFKRPPFNLVSD